MPVPLTTRADVTLDAVRRVAWDGEAVELAPAALARMDGSHAAFAAFVEARVAEDPGALIYGTHLRRPATLPRWRSRRRRRRAARPGCGAPTRSASHCPSASRARSCSRA